MFGQITKVIHQISYPKSCSTRQTVQCHSHGGPGLDGAVGHDGFQTPHPGVSISEVCNLGNNADQPQIPGWVCQDPDQARPGQAEGTTPASQGAPSRRTAGQIMGGSHGPPCATIHRSEILWKNGCQDNSLFDSQAENVQGTTTYEDLAAILVQFTKDVQQGGIPTQAAKEEDLKVTNVIDASPQAIAFLQAEHMKLNGLHLC